jgi:hypothetical protein
MRSIIRRSELYYTASGTNHTYRWPSGALYLVRALHAHISIVYTQLIWYVEGALGYEYEASRHGWRRQTSAAGALRGRLLVEIRAWLMANIKDTFNMFGQRNRCKLNYDLFISVFNQLDAQNMFNNKFYYITLHVSSTCAHLQEAEIALHRLWYHHTYRCDDTRGCVMQFWPPDDEHMVLETCRGMK